MLVGTVLEMTARILERPQAVHHVALVLVDRRRDPLVDVLPEGFVAAREDLANSRKRSDYRALGDT